MGGFGSTRWSVHTPRPVAEESFPLRIRSVTTTVKLALANGRAAGTEIVWQTGAATGVIVRMQQQQVRMLLHYSYRDEAVADWISLTSTVAGQGRRWWFTCPDCEGRIGVLYRPGRWWRCRHCLHITYQSSNDSKLVRILARGFDADELDDMADADILNAPIYFKAAHLVDRRKLRATRSS